ncbi:hypothetical protein 1 [Wuhan insect virus 27]|uniref:Major coat protein L-A virus domain-containing protein n=1 Tax=Wuhan insect virus 27 TaxID=1923731 RepID=A0A1L3KFC1_9VIRU|nr:hypothetical protein 1 [Wuhan insect virus 27]APG76057.1 hypothetical protein 1 [Wuhan insect virus 27]
MPLNFVNSLTNFSVSRKYVPSVKNGRFSVINDTVATMHAANSTYNCDLQLRTDFFYSGANTKLVEIDCHSSYYGYNRKYIDENGAYDPSLAIEEFARVAPEKRVVKSDVMALLQSHTQRDSHEAYLFNMLISYGFALLKKMNNDKLETLNISTPEYRDSHYQVNLADSTGAITQEIELGVPNDCEEMDQPLWDLRREDNYFKKPYYLHYNAASRGQEVFYLSHVFGRKRRSRVNFDLDISGIDTEQLTLDPLNGKGYLPASYDGVPWDKPETLWMWIVDYVKLNRLEQNFAPVVECFAAVATQPLWESSEACVWQLAKKVVSLSSFSPTRARLRTNLDGEPYVVDPEAVSFLYNEVVDPASYLYTAVVANYYELYGLYTLLDNEAANRENWRDVYTSTIDDLGVIKTHLCRAACVSVVTGLEIGTTMHEGCFTYYDTSDMSFCEELTDCVSLDGSPATIPITTIPAPVSGSLVLGTLSGPFATVQHLKGLQKLPVHEDRKHAYNAIEVVQLANVYRLFGNDTTFQSLYGQKMINPWATAATCVTQMHSTGATPVFDDGYLIVQSEPRGGRHYVIPNLRSLTARDEATLTIRQPMLTVTDFQKRTLEARPFVKSEKITHKAEFKIKATMSTLKNRFIAKPVPSMPNESVFRFNPVTTTPRMPEGTRVTATQEATEDIVLTTQSMDNAGAVE